VDVIYLSVKIVLSFHARALKEHGGIAGLRSRELLESAVFQPRQSAFGEDAYRSLMEINAPLRPACSHSSNGYVLDQTDDQIYEAFIGLGSKQLSQPDFFAWIERFINCRRVSWHLPGRNKHVPLRC
jgi:prophage maintenance system killer protein